MRLCMLARDRQQKDACRDNVPQSMLRRGDIRRSHVTMPGRGALERYMAAARSRATFSRVGTL